MKRNQLLCCLFLLLLACQPSDSSSTRALTQWNEAQPETQVSDFDSAYARWQETGDTLLRSVAEMRSLIPPAPKGYRLDDSSATELNHEGLRMSQAEAVYTRGEQEIHLVLTDYIQNYRVWTAMAEMYNSDYTSDTDEELVCALPADADEQFAWLTWMKPDARIRVQTGLQYRYLLSIDISPATDTSGIRALIRRFDFSRLGESQP